MRTTKFFLLAAFAAASAFSQCALVYNPFMNTWDCGGASGTVGGATNLTVAGAIPFVSTPGVLTTAPTQLFWDPVNLRLGVGTNTPSVSFQVAGPSIIQGMTVGRGGGAISSNTAIGTAALAANTTGAGNAAVGLSALAANTTAINNVAVGTEALSFSNTNNNTAIGYRALYVATTGSQNTAVGSSAMGLNQTGVSNVAIGLQALGGLTSGSTNVAVGLSALRGVTTSSNNVGVGQNAGFTGTAGANAVTTGANNTFIGTSSGLASTTQRSGSVAIGSGALVDASNAGVLGTAGMKWSVGGVQAPATTFHVQDTTASTGVTQVLVRAGDGQSSSNLTQWQTADGLTALLTVSSDGGLRWQADTGIARNAAGLLEVNSGTAGQYRDITYRIAQWRNGTEATCDATTRGQVVMVQGGAGVADTLRVCAKDAADAYAWTALY